MSYACNRFIRNKFAKVRAPEGAQCSQEEHKTGLPKKKKGVLGTNPFSMPNKSTYNNTPYPSRKKK